MDKESLSISKWDDYFMLMAYVIASKSKDKSTHVGAVVVDENNAVKTQGYNSFVRRLNDDVPERQESPEKYYWIEHAERNAIYNATLIGVSLKKCRMYTNAVPCTDCARGIIQSGIIEVIVDANWKWDDSDKWRENIKRSLMMFNETGIKLRYWEGKLPDRVVKFRNGKILG